MSFLFDNAVPNFLRNTDFPGIGTPLTLACKTWCDEDGTSFQCPLSVGDNSGGNYWGLALMMAGAGDPLRAYTRSAGGNVSAEQAGVKVNGWSHCAGVYASDSSRYAYVDGVKSSEQTSTITPNTPDRVKIGSMAGTSYYYSGLIRSAGVWTAALTDAEILRLAKGEHPRTVRPESLIFHLDMLKRDLRDDIGHLLMSENGSIVLSGNNPRIFKKYDPRLNYGFLTAGGTIYDMSASGEIAIEGSAALSALKNMVGPGELEVEGSANISNLISLAGAGEIAVEGSADITNLISLVANGEIAVEGSAEILAIIGMSATGEIAVEGTAALNGIFGLKANGEIAAQGQAFLNMIATMAANGEIAVEGYGNLTLVGVDEFDNVSFFTVTKKGDIIGEVQKRGDVLTEVTREGS